MWIKRDIYPFLETLRGEKPVIVLTGARQTGKTALFEHAWPDVHYVSLDIPSVAEHAEMSGQSFLAQHGAPLIVDEVQHAPGLFRHLKAVVDADRSLNGRYLLTGSQKFSLMQGVSESLAGRAAIVELHSLSLHELEVAQGQRASRADVSRWMFQGGYPEIHAAGLDPLRFYGDYLATYLERDVRQLLQVRNLRDFDRFMRMAAARTSQLLSMNSFASDLGVSPNTVRGWLSVLEASNVIALVEPFFDNLGKRIVKTPKLYFLDTGLAAYLCGLRSEADIASSQLRGALFENIAYGQIVRWFSNQGLQPNVYFYRDHHGHEVDFVIPVGEKLKLIECKWSERPDATPSAFAYVEKLAGAERVLSKTIFVPDRGRMQIGDVWIEDIVEPLSLAL